MGGRRYRSQLVIPIVASAAVLVLAGAGFLTYWLVAGQGGSSSHATISAGAYHSCARLPDGKVVCWGRDDHGELGNGATASSSVPVEVSVLTKTTAISAGGGYYRYYGDHSCALIPSGTIECWGYNDDGELGNGTQADSNTPVTVSGIANATQVAAGDFGTCALLTDGTVDCWGYNSSGELGDGSMQHGHAASDGFDVSPIPVQVTGITNATQLSSGAGHVCALLSGGSVSCWGDNSYGEVGDGTTENRSAPVQVDGITNAIQVSAGGWSHSCVLLSGGTVECWGYNNHGELGNGTTTESDTPVLVSSITNATEISAGAYQTCALLSNGKVECWGRNDHGQLGNGTTADSSTPVEVRDIKNATQISSGGGHTCAVLSSGKVECWGYNNNGQLGDGTTTNSSTPVSVVGLS